ncbi:hypothetical protein [Kitasatospora sp. NPDC004289]
MPPNVPTDLLDRIRALEDRLRLVEGRSQTRPALSAITGDVTITDGGQLIVRTPGGQNILFIGRVAPDHPDTSPQQGLLVRREDGTLALSVWSASGSGAQPVQVFDKNGQILFADDITAGGLARPYLSTDAWFSATAAPTDTTSSGSFVTLQHLMWKRHHPRVTAGYLVQTSVGTTGEIRLTDDAANVVAGPISISSGTFTWSSVTGTLPGTFLMDTNLHWQARVTGGAGTIGVRGLSTWGVQS